MRIAMLTNNYKPFVAGVPISIERLSEGLKALGHEVYIFAPTYENQVEEEDVIRYRSYKRTLDGNVVIPNVFDRTIEKQFKALDIDIIHAHHPNMIGWIAQYLGKKYKIPVVYTYHTRYEQYLHHFKPFEKLQQMGKDEGVKGKVAKSVADFAEKTVVPKVVQSYANACETVFAPTKLMEDVLQEMGVESSIRTLPTGLEPTFFDYNQSQVDALRDKYKGDKKHLFCTVARLAKEKNLTFVLEGLSELKKMKGDTFRTLIIGEGPEKEALQKLAETLDIEDNVIFVGKVPNAMIKNYYAAAELFVFASKSETQGIVLLEAMAAHNPVVAVEASGVVEVVRNNENGYMTAEDTKEWAARIAEVMDDEVLATTLREGAYKTAKSFGSEEVARCAAQYYRQAIKGYEMIEDTLYKETYVSL
ncbi:MAG: glycosyltransferase [Cellulosilyticaceae bacterium]